jgi:hypothetical protein
MFCNRDALGTGNPHAVSEHVYQIGFCAKFRAANQEDQRLQLHHGGSLKSSIYVLIFMILSCLKFFISTDTQLKMIKDTATTKYFVMTLYMTIVRTNKLKAVKISGMPN